MSGWCITNSITKLPSDVAGQVLVSGSHGGIYPGYLAARARLRAVVLNDAGIGKDAAGIGALPYCDALSMAAAVIDYRSARIGDGQDMHRRGIISRANPTAQRYGIEPGMTCREATERLQSVPVAQASARAYDEARTRLESASGPLDVWLIDSASLVDRETDRGHILITGSHGGMIGDDPWLALQADARAAVFNDAGIGIDDAGITRLPVLAQRSIVAFTVAAASARIGDADSTYRHGVVSRVNSTGEALGIVPGQSCSAAVQLLQDLAIP